MMGPVVNRLAIFAPLTFALLAMSAQAAVRVDLHALNVTQVSHQYALASTGLSAAVSTRQRHAEMLGLDANSTLQPLAATRDANGTMHYRYQQLFRGLPIFGENVIVTQERSGKLRNLFGRAVNGLASELPATVARFGKTQALSSARIAALGHRSATMRTEREDVQEMVYVDDAGHAHIAYVVSFFADSIKGGQPTRPIVIVDANNGRILKRWDGLTTSLIGTGPGGNEKTGQYQWGANRHVRSLGYLDVIKDGTTCTFDSPGVRSVNLGGGSGATTTAYAYECPRNTFQAINGAYSPINDAHYFGGVIQRMYQAYTGGPALSFQLIMRVHYGSSYQNAFWDGAEMNFGDGADKFYPLVSADVAGHEVSHGFTEQHSRLIFSGQSGGMNEAFSDMGGETTEYYWKGSNDFMIGADIVKGDGAIRYLCDPTYDGRSIDNAANYTSTLDVHYSSGVYNKAFCTLARTSGWNTATAFTVFARANALYWTPSSTFISGACGVETAATDLGLSADDVTAAFAAVGVSCAVTDPNTTGGELTEGVTVGGVSATAGNYVLFTLEVPEGATDLSFAQWGGFGDADLMVKLGSVPTSTSYDCRPFLAGSSETCTFANPTPGTYYVRMQAYTTFSGVSLENHYTVP
jgi:vibriolysin